MECVKLGYKCSKCIWPKLEKRQRKLMLNCLAEEQPIASIANRLGVQRTDLLPAYRCILDRR